MPDTPSDLGIGRGPELVLQRAYSWSELAELFHCEPGYFGTVGGMVPRPKQNALLLITHPGGAKSFDYEDYWEGSDLIYTGRGKTGDQKLTGPNRDLAEGRRKLFAFEASGTRVLKYLGSPACIETFPGRGLDANGVYRRTIKYRLRFKEGDRMGSASPTESPVELHSAPRHRKSRPFDPDWSPKPPALASSRIKPEELAQLQEKANSAHQAILVALYRAVRSAKWSDVEQVDGAIDLWGVHGGQRVIFEAKSVSDKNEVGQARSALAQLLEYRHFYGAPGDALCIVTNVPLSPARALFLESQGVAAIFQDADRFRGSGPISQALVERLGFAQMELPGSSL